jgi:hypothetical protein
VRDEIKKWHRRLAKDPLLSEQERWLLARTLAASPYERWLMNERFILSLPSSARSRLKKFRS